MIPIRLVLGALTLGVAHAAGAGWAPALLGFAAGAVAIVFLAGNDPRARLLGRGPEPLAWPGEATVAPRWRQAMAATLPSTVGVTLLSLAAAAFQPTLAAVLAGVCAGLGVAALFALPRIDPTLHVDPASGITYRLPDDAREQ